MFAIVITEKGGSQHREVFDQNEVTIGRVQGNDIILGKGNVSKRHSRLVRKDGRFIVVDLKSTNGTYVNGRKITAPLVVKPGDKIYIGDFILTVEADGAPADSGAPMSDLAPPPSSVPAPPVPDARFAPPPVPRAQLERSPLPESPTSRPVASAPVEDDEPITAPPKPPAPVSREPITSPTTSKAAVVDLVRAADEAADARAHALAELGAPSTVSTARPSGSARRPTGEPLEAAGLGMLDALFADASVREILIHGPHDVSVDRGAGLEPVTSAFADASELETVLTRLFAHAGEALDRSMPIHEAVLPNGAYVSVILPPVAVRGPIVEIRRLGKGPTLDELVARGFLGTTDRSSIERAVAADKNVFVVGPAGSGVTHLVGAIAGLLPARATVVTVEAVPDLRLDRPGTISLAAGRGLHGLSFADVLERANTLRGDRLVIDDVGAADLGRVLALLAARSGGNVVGVRAALPADEDAIHALASFAKLGEGVRSAAIDACVTRVADVVVEIEVTAAGRRVRRVVLGA